MDTRSLDYSSFGVIWGFIGDICGLHRDNRQEHGNYGLGFSDFEKVPSENFHRRPLKSQNGAFCLRNSNGSFPK